MIETDINAQRCKGGCCKGDLSYEENAVFAIFSLKCGLNVTLLVPNKKPYFDSSRSSSGVMPR